MFTFYRRINGLITTFEEKKLDVRRNVRILKESPLETYNMKLTRYSRIPIQKAILYNNVREGRRRRNE